MPTAAQLLIPTPRITALTTTRATEDADLYLKKAAQTALDQDPVLFNQWLVEQPNTTLVKDITTRAQLRQVAAQSIQPRSITARAKLAWDEGRHWIYQENFWWMAYPFMSAAAASAVIAISNTGHPEAPLTPLIGIPLGAAFATASMIGERIMNWGNYFLFWSRKYESKKAYDEAVKNLAEEKVVGDEISTNVIARLSGGLLAGGAATSLLYNDLTATGTGHPVFDAALLLGGAILAYAPIMLEPWRRYQAYAQAEKDAQALRDLSALADREDGEVLLVNDLKLPIGVLEKFLDENIKSEIKAVMADIDAISARIAETNQYYGQLQWSRLSPAKQALNEQKRLRQITAYERQRDRLSHQVLDQLHESKLQARFLIDLMKIELGEKTATESDPETIAKLSDAQYEMLVDQQVALREQMLAQSEQTVDQKAARATVLVSLLKQIIRQVSVRKQTYEELRALSIAPELATDSISPDNRELVESSPDTDGSVSKRTI